MTKNIEKEMDKITLKEEEIGLNLFNKFQNSITEIIFQHEKQINDNSINFNRSLNISLINLIANIAYAAYNEKMAIEGIKFICENAIVACLSNLKNRKVND